MYATAPPSFPKTASIKPSTASTMPLASNSSTKGCNFDGATAMASHLTPFSPSLKNKPAAKAAQPVSRSKSGVPTLTKLKSKAKNHAGTGAGIKKAQSFKRTTSIARKLCDSTSGGKCGLVGKRSPKCFRFLDLPGGKNDPSPVKKTWKMLRRYTRDP